MTHGDHWAAIDPDHERLIEEMLSIVGTKGQVVVGDEVQAVVWMQGVLDR